MKLYDYIKSLNKDSQVKYAKRCNTTYNYLINHILHARKECRKELRKALSEKSNGSVSHMEVLEHFGMVEG